MTELDLKQIRNRIIAADGMGLSDSRHQNNEILALLDRLEKAELEVVKRQEAVEHLLVQYFQLGDELKERDAQLKVCVELLNEAERLVGTKTDALRSKELIWIGKYMNAKEALEKVGAV